MAAPFDLRLLRLVPQTRRPVGVLGALGVLGGLATIASAFALTTLVVAVVRGEPILTPALATLGIFALRAVLAAVSERVAAWAGAQVSTQLREELVATWLQRPAEERPEPSRALTLAAQGTASVEPYVAKYLPTLVTAAVVPPLVILTLLVLDWPAALVVILTLPLLPLFAVLIGMSTAEDTRKRWRALSDLSGHFLDVMTGLPTLVTYGRGDRQVRSVQEVSQRHRRATMRTLRLAFMSSAALELLATISVAIVAVLVGLRLTYGAMDLWVGMLTILLAPEAYWPVRRVGGEFHSAADGAEAVQGILAELASRSSAGVAGEPGTKGAEPGAVVVTDLSYTYPGTERAVLDGVSLSAGSGLTAVTGTSGVGKTTLLELVAGLRTPTAGTVLAPAVHLVTQRPFFGAPTLRGNLALGRDADDAAMWTALREVGLEGFVAGLPQGLSTPVGDDGFGLSAGQRARLVLARAVLSPASVILLDEPTAHLDVAATASVHDAIERIAQTRTVIAVTHRPELVARADHHVHLESPTDSSQAGPRSAGDHGSPQATATKGGGAR
ncbi:thiol reductant ABC exporter subunit CydD [Janibacter sp. YIM B02568]|uniref:thiol reductant ABC exporter subunit CydD n=1 Tax=Janibacter endophyticus TaxID=2806261 RepID=UPI001950E99F|nr:thiol reductant ABC exporter subunit CydD [Janibacter endophyticus]MBM6544676.1 thiol reductant ABC exporter subunit CydD [Janibacter endophyticus]